MTHEESWQQNFELLKAYIEEHHHLPDKKKVENRGAAFVGAVYRFFASRWKYKMVYKDNMLITSFR